MDDSTSRFSQTHSESEANLLSVVLTNAENKINNSLSCKAAWLLSDFDDDVWITSNRGRQFTVDGKWKSAITVSWDISLPDGLRLTNPKYSALLGLSKRIAFTLRNGGVEGSFGITSWRKVVNDLKNFIIWTVVHERKLKVETYLFSKITQRDIDTLIYNIAVGGWFHALNIPVRVVSAISKLTEGAISVEGTNDDLMNLTPNDVGRVIEWFDQNGFYKKVYRGSFFGKKYLDRGKVAKLIDMEPGSVACSRRFLCFLRQFESDFWFTPLAVSVVQRHEFADQNTFTRGHFKSWTSTKKELEVATESIFKIFNAASEINSKFCPHHLLALPVKSASKFSKLCREQGTTKFVPIDAGLTYFNEAMRWVESYGTAIVDCYCDSIGSINTLDFEKMRPSERAAHKKKVFSFMNLTSYKFKNSKMDSLAKLISNNTYSRSSVLFNFEEMRNCPSLEEAIRILVGACVVCISVCKPSRSDEIVHLNRDCLVLKEDGYYLKFSLGKSNHNESYQVVEKPIPVIAANAISLLQKLGSAVEKTAKFKNRGFNENKLFNLPSYSVGRPRLLASNILCDYLDVFCDYVNLPPVNGVRWYIRIHEMRKWFLLLLFWGGKYNVLDACRWVAGHTDPSHIYSYIKREFPGEELPSLEAQYAIDRLVDLELRGNCAENGLEKIYQRVLTHFGVDALSLVPNIEWEDYVVAMRKRENFTIEQQFVFSEESNALTSINISFVLRKS